MRRAFLIVLDSVGIGGAPDAASYGDEGSNTLGHIATACAAGKADRAGLRSGPLVLPHLAQLGLSEAARLATGSSLAGVTADKITGLYAAATERSRGKDTPSGHWEIAGVPVPFDWGYFPVTVPCFPDDLIADFIGETGIPGILGNCHASGTEIIDRFGAEHMTSGKPILYTSADSVIQIAAHEESYGLARLLEHCQIARKLVDRLTIGRVIARPFIGDATNGFTRTANRRDYAIPPPEPTLLTRVEDSGRGVIGIGKIGDIFAHQNITEVRKAAGNMALVDLTLSAFTDARDGDLVFTNLVDFDTNFGHRRDVAGYASALEAFDQRLPELLAAMADGDLLMITADHGCDPTWTGTDHTRERVPVLLTAKGLAPGSAGVRTSFADMAETIAVWLGLPAGRHGKSMI